LQDVADGLDPVQSERLRRMQAQGINPTRGELLQDPGVMGKEEAMRQRFDPVSEMTGSPQMRQTREAQSKAFELHGGDLAADAGVADDAGFAVKEALDTRLASMRQRKNMLYERAAAADPQLADLPIVADDIIGAIPGREQMQRLERMAGVDGAGFRDLLTEFGLIRDEEIVESFIKRGYDVKPITFRNFEDFRQGLNDILSADDTGRLAARGGRDVLRALDDELEIAFKNVSEMDGVDATALADFQAARAQVREMMLEFDPAGMSQKFLATQGGRGAIPVVDESMIHNAIIRPGTSREAIKRLFVSLEGAGEKGAQAIGNVQAATVMRMLDDALSQTANTGSAGQQLITPNAFARSFQKIDGDSGRLAVIFANNKPLLRRLRSLNKTARDLTTPSQTMPKGSGPFVAAALGVLTTIRTTPVVKTVVDAVAIHGPDAYTAARSHNPQASKYAVEYMNREYPALAGALATAAVAKPEDEQDDQ